MRRRARLAAILAIFAVAGATAALLTTRTASAFPPGTCNGSSCTGSKTDSFTGVPVCHPGTTVYWEDSYLPADVTNVRLAKFTVTPSPPCTGATVGAPTSDPWPASPKDPDGTTPAGEPGKKPFRFRWTVTVPQGSTSNGTMTVAWTLDWTKASGGGTTTTSGTPCPASGALPAHCRYDLEVHISAPDYFSARLVHLVRVKITVFNNGPAASPQLTAKEGWVRFQAFYEFGHSGIAIGVTGPDSCQRGQRSAVFCDVRSLHPHGQETFAFAVRWTAHDKQSFIEDQKTGRVSLTVIGLVSNHHCEGEETDCANNRVEESIATK